MNNERKYILYFPHIQADLDVIYIVDVLGVQNLALDTLFVWSEFYTEQLSWVCSNNWWKKFLKWMNMKENRFASIFPRRQTDLDVHLHCYIVDVLERQNFALDILFVWSELYVVQLSWVCCNYWWWKFLKWVNSKENRSYIFHIYRQIWMLFTLLMSWGCRILL